MANACRFLALDVSRQITGAGTKRGLADAGLDGTEAALDIRDLRSLLASIRFVRRTAVQTTVHIITTSVILALLAGIALKLKVFGGDP